MLLDIPDGYPGPVNPTPGDVGEIDVSLFPYVLWRKAYEIALPLTGILLGLHFVFFIAHKWTRPFQAMFLCGCSLELVGFVYRIRASRNQWLVSHFVIQYATIVAAPAFHSAAIYLVLVKVLPFLPDGSSRLSVKHLYLIFGSFSAVAAVLQFTGAGLLGSAVEKLAFDHVPSVSLDTASHLLTAGLAIQCAGGATFLAVNLPILLRILKLPTVGTEIELKDIESGAGTDAKDANEPELTSTVPVLALQPAENPKPTVYGPGNLPPPRNTRYGPGNLPPRKSEGPDKKSAAQLLAHRHQHMRLVLLNLLVSTLLVLGRTLFRTISSTQGLFKGAYTNQTFFVVFEMAPILIADGLWALYPLGRLIDSIDPQGKAVKNEEVALKFAAIQERAFSAQKARENAYA